MLTTRSSVTPLPQPPRAWLSSVMGSPCPARLVQHGPDRPSSGSRPRESAAAGPGPGVRVAPDRTPKGTRSEEARARRAVSPDDVNPRHRWDRPLQAPGHMQVDFEERVGARRLHAYGLGRARRPSPRRGSAPSSSSSVQHPLPLGDGHRRVGARQAHALVPAHGQRRAVGVGLRVRGPAPPPSTRRRSPPTSHSPAVVAVRRAVSPKAGLFVKAARNHDILKAEGVGGAPHVVEPPLRSRSRSSASRSATASRSCSRRGCSRARTSSRS